MALDTSDSSGARPRLHPVPDGKDWTWVLDRTCPECGLDTRQVQPENVGALLRDNASGWRSVLAGPEASVRARPTPYVWSALEYGCHVRDVFRLYDERLHLMLTEDGPHYPNWDQDATAVQARYSEQDPAQVCAVLLEAAQSLADGFDRVEGDQWQRTGVRSDGASFTVATFARYLVHDPIHHLHDVLRAR
jgi:DinB superfamily